MRPSESACDALLAAGELVEVFPEWKAAPLPVLVVYPHGRHLAPQVRIFIDWVSQIIKDTHG